MSTTIPNQNCWEFRLKKSSKKNRVIHRKERQKNMKKQEVKTKILFSDSELSTGVTVLSPFGDKVVTPYIDIKNKRKNKKEKEKRIFSILLGQQNIGTGVYHKSFNLLCGRVYPFKPVPVLSC